MKQKIFSLALLLIFIVINTNAQTNESDEVKVDEEIVLSLESQFSETKIILDKFFAQTIGEYVNKGNIRSNIDSNLRGCFIKYVPQNNNHKEVININLSKRNKMPKMEFDSLPQGVTIVPVTINTYAGYINSNEKSGSIILQVQVNNKLIIFNYHGSQGANTVTSFAEKFNYGIIKDI